MKKLAALTFLAALLTACGGTPNNTTPDHKDSPKPKEEKQYLNLNGNWTFKIIDPSTFRYIYFNLPISDNGTGKFSGKSIMEVEGYTNVGISLTGDFIGSYEKSEFSAPGKIELYQKLPPKTDGTLYEECYANNQKYNTKIVITGTFYEKDFYGDADYQPCIGGAFRSEHNSVSIRGTKK